MQINNMEDKTQYISYWIRRFFCDYMVTTMNKSHNTQKCYRDCIKMLLAFTSEKLNKRVDKILVNDITADLVLDFLNHLEKDRGNSVKSRNNRRSAIMTFANFVAVYAPEFVEWSRMAHLVPLKKHPIERKEDGYVKPVINYLTKEEMNVVLESPDRSTDQGRRDYALLTFLYNSGARASEVANLRICNLTIPLNSNDDGTVDILGKGGKVRTCPIWGSTLSLIRPLIQGRDPTENVFLNRYGEPITRHGVYELVTRHADRAATTMPSIKDKSVSPHTIRHTTATMMLSAGIDINVIRAWLGHVSVNTTNIYAEVDLRMKAQAIKICKVSDRPIKKDWKNNKDLMDFLNNI